MKINSEITTLTKEELFKSDYHDIKTFEDACAKLGIQADTLIPCDGADIQAYKQAQALYKLLIIQKAINNSIWREKNSFSYFPYWTFLSKEEMERMSEEKKQRKGIRHILSCAVTDDTGHSGVRGAIVTYRGMIVNTDCGFPMFFNSKEAALYAAKQFESLFFDYYGITIKK